MRVKKGKPEKQLGQIILAVRMSVWLVLKWSLISFGPREMIFMRGLPSASSIRPHDLFETLFLL